MKRLIACSADLIDPGMRSKPEESEGRTLIDLNLQERIVLNNCNACENRVSLLFEIVRDSRQTTRQTSVRHELARYL